MFFFLRVFSTLWMIRPPSEICQRDRLRTALCVVKAPYFFSQSNNLEPNKFFVTGPPYDGVPYQILQRIEINSRI